LALFCAWHVYLTHNNNSETNYSRNMFICALICCVLEWPRYILMAQDEYYGNQMAYGMHIYAGAFFFLAYTYLCFMFQYISDVTEKNKVMSVESSEDLEPRPPTMPAMPISPTPLSR
jgi:hypothetical protein